MRFILLLILSVSLSACGFNFSGQEAHSLGCLKRLYLQVDNPYSPIAKELREILTSSGAMLTRCRSEAPHTLEIVEEGTDIYTGGFGFSNQVSLSTVKYHLTYQILDRQGAVIMGPRTITTQQSITININQALSGNLFPPSLLNEMRRNAIYQLMEQLNSNQLQSKL